jgi:hypothetical protein
MHASEGIDPEGRPGTGDAHEPAPRLDRAEAREREVLARSRTEVAVAREIDEDVHAAPRVAAGGLVEDGLPADQDADAKRARLKRRGLLRAGRVRARDERGKGPRGALRKGDELRLRIDPVRSTVGIEEQRRVEIAPRRSRAFVVSRTEEQPAASAGDVGDAPKDRGRLLEIARQRGLGPHGEVGIGRLGARVGVGTERIGCIGETAHRDQPHPDAGRRERLRPRVDPATAEEQTRE